MAAMHSTCIFQALFDLQRGFLVAVNEPLINP